MESWSIRRINQYGGTINTEKQSIIHFFGTRATTSNQQHYTINTVLWTLHGSKVKATRNETKRNETRLFSKMRYNTVLYNDTIRITRRVKVQEALQSSKTTKTTSNPRHDQIVLAYSTNLRKHPIACYRNGATTLQQSKEHSILNWKTFFPF